MPLRGSRPWDDDVGLRWALEDSVETGRHTLRIVAAVVALVAVAVDMLRLKVRPTCLQHLSLEILLLFLLFSKSFADFCFSADSRRLSRSTSSSITGGFEDRASIDPYTSEDKS